MTKVRLKRKTTQKKLTNHVAFVLDSSGSMSYISRPTVDAFNRNLNDLQVEAKKTGQSTTMSLIIFGDPDVRVELVGTPIDQVLPMSYSDYRPNGGTPLFDAMQTAITELKLLPGASGKNTSFLMVTITDGEENQSSATAKTRVPKLLKELIATDHWTFAFQVPFGGRQTLLNFGIPDGNIQEWEASTRGAYVASMNNAAGFHNYFTARSLGSSSTMSFYTDASKLKPSALKKDLTDVSKMVKSWTVDHEVAIKDFVETKNKGNFVLGAAYYPLRKTEKIQHYKQVLIQEKGKNSIYAGEEARELIGLPPTTDHADAKVTPGNHGNYDIYVQSTSVNRKLSRGEKILYRLDHTTPSQPTWTSKTATTTP